jgi:hypothetical protein
MKQFYVYKFAHMKNFDTCFDTILVILNKSLENVLLDSCVLCAFELLRHVFINFSCGFEQLSWKICNVELYIFAC